MAMQGCDPEASTEISHQLEQELLADEEFYLAVKKGHVKNAAARAAMILWDMLDESSV
jgi:hypothetical protein